MGLEPRHPKGCEASTRAGAPPALGASTPRSAPGVGGTPHVQQYAGPVRVDSLGVSRVSPGHMVHTGQRGPGLTSPGPGPHQWLQVSFWKQHLYTPLPQIPQSSPCRGNRLSTGRGHVGGGHWISPSGFGRGSVFLSLPQALAQTRCQQAQGRVSR